MRGLELELIIVVAGTQLPTMINSAPDRYAMINSARWAFPVPESAELIIGNTNPEQLIIVNANSEELIIAQRAAGGRMAAASAHARDAPEQLILS